ncbi:MAG: glycosyltransferase [Bryobacteraceae bacterium]
MISRSSAAVLEPGEAAVQWHVITPEYPPELGGVSDYTQQLCIALAASGDEVHVWCPGESKSGGSGAAQFAAEGLTVHRELGGITPADLGRVGERLDQLPGPRRLLVQWVPHGYGYKSANLPFCWWVLRRARRHGDQVELMVHEPFLNFRWGALRQNAAAAVHRLMTVLLLRSASRVWMSIPGWERYLRPYALGRKLPFQWLPIFSNVPVANNESRTQAVRNRYASDGSLLAGHFGTFGRAVANLLEPIVLALAKEPGGPVILLMGHKSESFRQQLVEREPALQSRIQAAGELSIEELSYHLAACDLLMQPYPDGVSSRRTSFMAGLSHGVPTVSTSGELTEPLWSESNAVALAAPGDASAFLEHVRRLEMDPSERRRMGRAASQLYRERFDVPHIILTLRGNAATRDRTCAS